MLGVELFENLERLVEDKAMLNERRIATVDVRAPAEDHLHTLPVGQLP
jgi:hypothetical protein